MALPSLTRRAFLATASALAGVPWGSSPTQAKAALNLSSYIPVPEGLRVASFSCDITPPLGSPLEECKPPVATAIDGPLLARGVVLSDGKTRYVLCALDWCELRTGAHDLFRKKLANAAQVNELQVEVHCIHQHDAPLYDVNGELLLAWQPSPVRMADLQFLREVTDRVAAAVRSALDRAQPLTHVGYGKAKVEKFASNRRVPMKDGTIGVRYSSTTDPVLIAAPEGLIDPWLRTITLFEGEKPLVRLHYYASHPQSYYGQGRMNPDTPGLARARLEGEEGIPQIYFTGCGGNVTAGKYNDGSHEVRVQLADRLYSGMKGAIGATQKVPVSGISWKSTEVRFALRREPEFSEAKFRKVIADPSAAYQERTTAAMALAWYERLKARADVDLSCYQLGPVYIVHLPGEAFVEYQLHAESLRPNDFVAVAAYGELGPGYVCTDKAFAEGGYEPTQSFVGPPSEARLKAALDELLRSPG